MDESHVLFRSRKPLGFEICATRARWAIICTVKHPVMRGREQDVARVLEAPDQVRRSARDPKVFLFYRLERPGRWLCAVAKCAGEEGFLITGYPTDAIKEGERTWNR